MQIVRAKFSEEALLEMAARAEDSEYWQSAQDFVEKYFNVPDVVLSPKQREWLEKIVEDLETDEGNNRFYDDWEEPFTDDPPPWDR